jgi:hypothetical protein
MRKFFTPFALSLAVLAAPIAASAQYIAYDGDSARIVSRSEALRLGPGRTVPDPTADNYHNRGDYYSGRRHYSRRHYNRRYRHRYDDDFFDGAFGFAAGAIVGGTAARVYSNPPARYRSSRRYKGNSESHFTAPANGTGNARLDLHR